MRKGVARGANAGGAGLRIAAALLALSAMGAGSPVGGPEVTVFEGNFTEEYLDTRSVRVASGEQGALVAWRGHTAGSSNGVIRASRVTSSQGIQDPGGITLTETTLSGGQVLGPALAVGTDAYLAVWGQQNLTQHEKDLIHGALLGSAGQGSLPPPTPFQVGEAQFLMGTPAVAFDSVHQRYLVVWPEPTQVQGRWVSATGQMPEGAFQVSGIEAKPITTENGLSVACKEGTCMVAWEDIRMGGVSIYAAPVGVGVPGPEAFIAQSPANAPYGVSLAGDPGGFLLVWASEGGLVEMSAALLDTSGAPQSAAPVSLHELGHAELPALASSADHQHLLTWIDRGDYSAIIRGAVLHTESGVEVPASAQDLFNLGPYYPPASVACPGAGEACWMAYAGKWDPGSGHLPVYGVQVSPTLGAPPQTSTQAEVSARAAAQGAPDVACGRSGACLATWREPNHTPNYGGQVGAMRLTPMSAGSLALKPPPDPSDPRILGHASAETVPVVTSSQLTPEAPEIFFVAWIGHTEKPVYVTHQIAMAVVSKNGVYRRNLGIENDVEKIGPAVASDGERFVVIWGAGGASGLAIRGVRVGLDGSVPEGEAQGAVLASGVHTGLPPLLVYDGEGFLLVWQMNDGVTSDLHGLRLDTSGPTLTPAGEPFLIVDSLMSPSMGEFAVASEGQGVSLVAWMNDDSLRAVRVSASGALQGEPVEIANGNGIHHPRVVFDGLVYLVSWREGRPDGGAVRGTWVGQDGAVLTPGGFPLSEAPPTPLVPGFVSDAALASDGAGRALLAHVRRRFDDGEGYVDFRRVRARLLGSPCAFGESPVSCVESECRMAGWCDPVTEACAGQVPKADGTACQGGLCVAGECVADPPMDSTSGTGGTGGGAAAADDGGSGCGCRVGATGSGGWPAAAAALGALAWLGRRRRDR